MSRIELIAVVLAGMFCLAVPGICQSGEPARDAYYDALDMVQVQGRITEGIERFNLLVQTYPESMWATSARLRLGHLTEDAQDAIAIYEQIAMDSPGSLAAAIALLSILDRQHPDNLETWLAGAKDLAHELGSPPLDEIFGENKVEENLALFRTFPQPKQRALAQVYSAIWGDIALRYGQKERAVPLAIFMRTALEPSGIDEGNALNVQLSLMDLQLTPPIITPGIEVDPIVTIQTPNAGSTTGPNPVLSATISVGDYRHVQASLSKTEITLDGVDIKAQTSFRSEINRVLEEDVTFETVHLSATLGPLSSGTHTLVVTVPIEDYREGPGLTTITRTFTVDPNHGSGPTTQTLPTTRDTTLLIRKPHQNEGANPRLHLKKVTGKPAQVLVGFDTSNIDTNGLTKASLVLNIDSTQNVTGWGNGRPIRAQRLLTSWTEGNGKTLDLPNNQKTAGSGSGATWFSPVDGNISNNFADSTVNWSGGPTYAAPSTAPTAAIKNHQSGEVTFDVTQDLLNGAEHGWLITRDQDVGSQVTFLSKEGGSSDLAPRLILEYGSSTANLDRRNTGLLAYLGLSNAPNLSKLSSGSELQTAREGLQDSPIASMLTEQFLIEYTRGNPAFSLVFRVAYRSWLEQEPRLAILWRELT